MAILEYYKSYKNNLPLYSNWSKEQDSKFEQRLEYLKNNPNKMDSDDIQRGKILLHAIDVIDEYSQSNAEDMEVATEMAMGQIINLAQTIGMLAGFGLMNVKGVQKSLAKIAGNNETLRTTIQFLPTLIGLMTGTAASFPAIVSATKLKVGASRRGRFEAMNKDLSNPAIFAVLTKEQKEKADELSKDIKIEDRDKKRLEQTKSMGINPLESLKTLKKMYDGEAEYKKQKEEFDNKLKQNGIRIGTVLSEKHIRDAKRDQQVLSDMVRKIDTASQDYAENTELVTNSIKVLALGTGGLVGWLSSKIMKAAKITQGTKFAKFIPWIVGFSIPAGIGIYAAKLQKQASRIGRFKIKQQMLNNPASMVYVDEKNLNITNDEKANSNKKPNIFDFATNIVKDYKAYN